MDRHVEERNRNAERSTGIKAYGMREVKEKLIYFYDGILVTKRN
jgi:hypothetical protein